MRVLDARESRIFTMLFWEGKTQKEIGILEGLDNSRISQIFRGGIRKIKKHFNIPMCQVNQ